MKPHQVAQWMVVVPLQAHCPIYLVNVSSMAAGDVVATAKMQGKAAASRHVARFTTLLQVLFRYRDSIVPL